jgi:hypothetical protein
MTTDPKKFAECGAELQKRLRGSVRATVLLGLADDELDAIAFDSLAWTQEAYADGIMDPKLVRRKLKSQLKQQYGSIVVMILFTIIWEIIKQWLFD